MKRIGNIVLFLAAVLLWSCEKAPDVEVKIHECAVMPSPRACAGACTLGNKAYVFGGRDAKGQYLNDLWEYDPQTDTWTSFPTPLKPRVNPSIIAYDGSLYMGLGFAHGAIYYRENNLQDWWKWNPMTNKWDSLAAYPNKTTNAATSFVVSGRIYVMYGASDGFSREIKYYKPEKNCWTELPDNYHRALSVFRGVGGVCQGKTYFGLGHNIHSVSQWYLVFLNADQWKKLSSLPGKGRTFSACSGNNQYIYVFGGRYFAGEHTGGEVFADIWRYDPVEDQWARGGLMPCGKAENQIAFTIDNKVYFGLGEDENGKLLNTLYRIEE
ncbi:MAG: hypothetical protein IKS76_06620 [Paludibacteraceae bacterium]|nr:hypothetical protein [Paludibacteraceae bacterium]MBR6492459.1 hypothetical protein [Paludibacteraceae bacterium]